MNALTIGNIRLPAGWCVLDQGEYFTSMESKNDTFTESWVLDVCGCQVQILRYNKSNTEVVVYIRGVGKIVKAQHVERYIRANT